MRCRRARAPASSKVAKSAVPPVSKLVAESAPSAPSHIQARTHPLESHMSTRAVEWASPPHACNPAIFMASSIACALRSKAGESLAPSDRQNLTTPESRPTPTKSSPVGPQLQHATPPPGSCMPQRCAAPGGSDKRTRFISPVSSPVKAQHPLRGCIRKRDVAKARIRPK